MWTRPCTECLIDTGTILVLRPTSIMERDHVQHQQRFLLGANGDLTPGSFRFCLTSVYKQSEVTWPSLFVSHLLRVSSHSSPPRLSLHLAPS